MSSSSNPMMKAAVLCEVGHIEVREVPRPVISAHELLVRVSAVGICGTDAHIFAGHANYNTDERGLPISLSVQPQILGHEIAGVIEEIGSSVDALRPGDRVVIDQGLNCMSRRRERLCEYCSSGDSHQCEFYGEHGITGLPGGLADFISVPAVNAIKMMTALTPAAALVEPLGCIIHSFDRAARAGTRHTINAPSTEQRVRSLLVCGAGPAGLLFTQYLRNVLGYDGALFVSDPNEAKRTLAKKMGADVTIDPVDCDVAEVVREHSNGKGVDYLVEASGAGAALVSIPRLISKQATVLLYGHGLAGVDLSVLNRIFFKEPALIATVGASGGFESDGRPTTYKRALSLIEEHRIDAAELITHTYSSFGEVESALARDMHSADYVKGVVVRRNP